MHLNVTRDQDWRDHYGCELEGNVVTVDGESTSTVRKRTSKDGWEGANSEIGTRKMPFRGHQ